VETEAEALSVAGIRDDTVVRMVVDLHGG